jgi:hypothetical protein
VANFHGDAHNHKEGRLEVKTGEEINTKKTGREKVIGVLREG